jgi:hypothetical protein
MAKNTIPMSRIARRGALCITALTAIVLAGCMNDDMTQPLSDLAIRSRLAGRTVIGTENGQSFSLHLQPDGIAVRDTATAEFGHWRTQGGLCLQWYGKAERCGPVYQRNVAHYRYGEIELSILGRP